MAKAAAPKPRSKSKTGTANSPKRGRGRPTDYRAEYCERVIALGREGKSKAQIACALDVHRGTLDDWAGRHAEFAVAIARARDLSLAWWEEQLERGIWAGKEFNATAYAFAMKNRFPDDYRDKHEHKVEGQLDVNLDAVRDGIAGRLARISAGAAAATVPRVTH